MFSKNREFVSRLRNANKMVYLITSGFDCLIEEIANELGIPYDHLFSNRLLFHYNSTFFYNLFASYCFHVKAFFVPQFTYYSPNINLYLYYLCFVFFCI